MKQFSKPVVLSAISFAAGLVCLCLRQWLLTAGVDSKGLLLSGHPGNILSMVLAAAVLIPLALSLSGNTRYRFIASPLSTTGLLIGALGYAWTAVSFFRAGAAVLSLVTGCTALLGAVGTLAAAVFQHKRARLSAFLHCPRILFYVLFLLCRYQRWSGEPELQRYLFALLGAVAMMLSHYRRAVAVDEKGTEKIYLPLSRAALFFCIAAIPGNDCAVLFGTEALSILLDGCTPVTRSNHGA